MREKFLNRELLIGKYWSYSKNGESPLTQTLELREDGTVRGGKAERIRQWDIRKNVLHLFDNDFKKVSRFVIKHDEIDSKAFYGQSMDYPNDKIILYLTDSNFAYTYEHVVKLENSIAFLNIVNSPQLQPDYYDVEKFSKDILQWLAKSYSEDNKIVEAKEILVDDKARINALISELIKKIDDSLIEKYVPYWLRHHFWMIKHGAPHIKPNELAPRFWFGYFVSPSEYLSGSISITEIHEHNGVFICRGFYTKPFYEGIELVCQNGSQIIIAESLPSIAVNKKIFLGEEIMPARTFSISIPCLRNDLELENINFYFRYQENLYATVILHTHTSRLAHKRGVFIGDYFIFSKPSDYAITYKSLSAKNITNDIVKKTNDFILEKFNENLMSYVKRRIWVFIDTPRTIDDNAEVLFRYASQFEDGIEKYFIIPDESYKILFDERLHDYLIVFGTWEQKLLYVIAEKIISSNSLQRSLIYPETFPNHSNLTKNQKFNYFALSNADYVFLSHGYTIGDSSTFINLYIADMQLLSIASDVELKNMSNGKYQYENIKVTGLPRYDRYRSDGKSEKVIVFMPTFDKRYVNNDLTYNKEYQGSKHWETIMELLNHPKLMDKLKSEGYTFLFKPHPYLTPQLSDFVYQSPVVLSDETWNYKRIMNDGAIAITDYSTAVFDFAYLKKPVLYLQNTANIKFKDEEIWTYEDNGFGEICTSVNYLVDEIITLIENDCQMSGKYKQHVDDFFTYQDRNNCQRTYEEIMKLPLHKRKIFELEHEI